MQKCRQPQIDAHTFQHQFCYEHALSQAERGATVILTQPPFDVERFYAWVEDARKRGVWETARLVVGHPMIR